MLSDIPKLRANAIKSAQRFIGTTESLTELGWGISGFVFLTPGLPTAIKVHHNSDAFEVEVKAYERLRQHRITSLLGLTIPRLHNFDKVRHLIQIDFVSPPFLLDFAGVSFSKPDFSAETTKEIFSTVDERFGKNAYIAYAVYHSLAKIGLYYLDLRPSNLNIEGLPGIDLTPEHDED